MDHLFAFLQAADVETTDSDSGHYDAEQQLWIADEISHAHSNDETPIVGQTRLITRGQATMTKDGPDFVVDAAFD